jgi:hypothetical protein
LTPGEEKGWGPTLTEFETADSADFAEFKAADFSDFTEKVWRYPSPERIWRKNVLGKDCLPFSSNLRNLRFTILFGFGF